MNSVINLHNFCINIILNKNDREKVVADALNALNQVNVEAGASKAEWVELIRDDFVDDDKTPDESDLSDSQTQQKD